MTVSELVNDTESMDTLPSGTVPYSSLIVSSALHLLGLCVFAAFAVPTFNRPIDDGIVIANQEVDTTLPSELGEEAHFHLSAGGSTGAEEVQTQEDLFNSVLAVQDSNVVAINDSTADIFMIPDTSLSECSLSQKVALSNRAGRFNGIGSGSGIGTGTGDGTGGGVGRRQFFALESKGKNIVFVVDASKSMNLPHPGPAKTRFNRVKQELVKTITQMTEDEQFFIIYFGDDALPMPAPALVAADEVARTNYLRWMVQVPAEGQYTRPLNGLLMALALEPDVIYFLTDGVFESAVIRQVSGVNRNRIPIHTIGFDLPQKNANLKEKKGNQQLEELAKLNNGTYMTIPFEE
ncbi:vWA domain-containing protein [Planctomicrobium sp. SH527]|uniref:vWA domain-containing protein n=1 Tax=Planctomicrobium sp. SH527 TaxID=3448123 RepID=UPI003F5C2E53